MKLFTCIIIDDEELALDLLEDYVLKIDALKLSGRFLDPVESFNFLQNTPIDLIFVDISMPGLSGLELIASLHKPPAVIITTAYREYAVEGFELQVLDYLVKPISFSRFLQSVNRFLETKKNAVATEPGAQYLIIRVDRRNIQLAVNEIVMVEGLKDYVKIHTESRTYLTKDSIGNFYKRLPKDQFCRVHRSFVVNKQYVHSYTHEDLQLGKQKIPMGATYKNSFFEFMQ